MIKIVLAVLLGIATITIAKRLYRIHRGKWWYKGVTNRLMNKHSWTNGRKTLSIYFMSGHSNHAGYVAEVTSLGSNTTLKLSNGFVSKDEALLLADMYMRDDGQSPAAFMHSNRIESDLGPANAVRQDEWLQAHSRDYEFDVIDPSLINFEDRSLYWR